MTIDSKYKIQPKANDDGVEYTFEMESIGEDALRVYIVDESVAIPDPEPAEVTP